MQNDQLHSAALEAAKLRSSILKVPSNFRFDDSGNNLYFLSQNAGSNTSGVYVARISSDEASSTGLTEREAVLANLRGRTEDTPLTKEEQLLRERTRSFLDGITSFSMFEQHNNNSDTAATATSLLLIPAGASIFAFNPTNQDLKEICDVSISEGAKMSVEVSPLSTTTTTTVDASTRFVSFVSNSNLFVMNLDTKVVRQITSTKESEGKLSGVAEYIMEEEFSRYKGYWWAPAPRIKNGEARWRILYLEVDESAVPKLSIEQHGANSGVDTYKYPRPGETNATSTMCYAEFNADFTEVTVKKFPGLLQEFFPWVEYVPRCGWLPDNNSVWLQLLDRKQQHATTVRFDLETEQLAILRTEESNIWINVSDMLHFFKDGSGFLCESEKTGFRNLYLYTAPETTTAVTEKNPRGVPLLYSAPPKQITLASDWQVDNDALWVDEQSKLVYFCGSKDTAVEQHVYYVSYNNNNNNNAVATDEAVRVTEHGFTYSTITFNRQRTAFACLSSNTTTQPRLQIYTKVQNGNNISFKASLEVDFGFSLPSVSFPLTTPELFHFSVPAAVGTDVETTTTAAATTTTTLYGAVYKPVDYNPQQMYPLLVYIYGGPHVQLVRNSFGLKTDGRVQLLVSLGFAVAVFDSRGSYRRGLHFEGAIRCKMGQIEITDQVRGVEYLAAHPHICNIDANNVGIYGWSYGGYSSLLALSQRSDIFRAAVAGAPVTDWRLYDTGYTERYMDTPTNNAEGYERGSVLHYADGFPDEEGRLLIIHGMADENVHFKNTEVLIEKLTSLRKPYDLKVYPQERHAFRSPDSISHFTHSMVRFFQRNLMRLPK